MEAMALTKVCEIKVGGRRQTGRGVVFTDEPLRLRELPTPVPGPGQVLIRVRACGVCRTELDQIEGRIVPPRLPVIPGHQPVGEIAGLGSGVTRFRIGDRAGATWIYSSCRRCGFCRTQRENLCEEFQGTGCHSDGGYASHIVISEDYACSIPTAFEDATSAAPLMCGGAIGYRSLKLSGMDDGKTIGLYGFGSAHHLLLQMVNHSFPNSKKFVMARNPSERALALRLGADWVGDIEEKTPAALDCAIDSTPAWNPMVHALGNLQRGGRLVVNLIRKENTDQQSLMKLDYARHMWLEKEIKTVANVTRRDAEDFLLLAAQARIRPEVQEFRLEEANTAIVELKGGKIRGSKVLVMRA